MAKGGGKDRVSTSALIRLLRRGDTEEATAAALVLGALRPKDPRVIPALAARLDEADSPLKPYFLDALARFHAKESLEILLPWLTVHGSLREQAVRLVANQGTRALAALKRLRKTTTAENRNTLVRVAARIPGRRALEFILDYLPDVDFDLAKALLGAIRERSDDLDHHDRRLLVDRVLAFLDSPAAEVNTTAEIAAIKILGALRDGAAAPGLLARASGQGPPVVRLNAVESLAALELTPSREARVIAALLPLVSLRDAAPPAVVAATLKILRQVEPPCIPVPAWIELAHSDHVEIARVAVAELRRHPKEQVFRTLLDALGHRNPAVQSAAVTALGEIPGAVLDLLAAHDDPRFAAHRDALRAVLASRGDAIPSELLDRLLAQVSSDEQEAAELGDRLQVLAAIDRTAVNRATEACARRALDAGDAPVVPRLLEPLVRGRLADPLGRYLLGVAHLALFVPGTDDPDGHFPRATQLFGPLARLNDFSLESHLLPERSLDAPRRRALVDFFAGRPEPERSLAQALRGTTAGPDP